MQNYRSFLQPGMIVQHPERPEWGIGQIQSATHNKITVNFVEAGKKVIDDMYVKLEVISQD